LRAPAPVLTRATSIVSGPARPSTRARSSPQRMISPSAPVLCDRPQARSTIASSRLVLPAAFGPAIRCGPGPNDASSAAYPRSPAMVIESSTTNLHPQCSAGSRAPRSKGELRDPVGPRIARPRWPEDRATPLARRSGVPSGSRAKRHDDVDVTVVTDRPEDTRRKRPVELEGELIGV